MLNQKTPKRGIDKEIDIPEMIIHASWPEIGIEYETIEKTVELTAAVNASLLFLKYPQK